MTVGYGRTAGWRSGPARCVVASSHSRRVASGGNPTQRGRLCPKGVPPIQWYDIMVDKQQPFDRTGQFDVDLPVHLVAAAVQATPAAIVQGGVSRTTPCRSV